jgi:hypothetical protein
LVDFAKQYHDPFWQLGAGHLLEGRESALEKRDLKAAAIKH